MNALVSKRLFVAFALIAIVSACSGGGAPPSSTQFSNALFPSFLLWIPTADGAPGGSNGTTGDAIVTTIPFDASAAGGPSDVGALVNQAGFFLAGGNVSPQQIDNLRSQPVSWSMSNNVAVLASAPPITPPPNSPPGSLSLPSHFVSGGSTAGVGTLSASVQNANLPIAQSVNVFTYPVVDVGCTDVGALPGANFATNDTYASQQLAYGGDLYVTGPTCSSLYNYNYAGSYTIHTPYGGTLLATGPIAHVNNTFYSNEVAPNFTQIAPSAWKGDFTSIDQATFEAAISPPCVQTVSTPIPLPSGIPNPLASVSGCTSTPDDVLLFKTQSGAIVKMYVALAHDGTTSGSNIVGAFEVTNASGAFPY